MRRDEIASERQAAGVARYFQKALQPQPSNCPRAAKRGCRFIVTTVIVGDSLDKDPPMERGARFRKIAMT